MADLVNSTDEGLRTRTVNRGTVAGAGGVSGAQTLDVSKARVFRIVKRDNGSTWTFSNFPSFVAPADGIVRVVLIIVQDSTGTALKPTLAATRDDGTAVTVRTIAGAAGGGAGALPTLSTAAGSEDYFEFVFVNSVTPILTMVASSQLAT